MKNEKPQYTGTGRFYYDFGTGFVYICEGLDEQGDIILRDVHTSELKVVSPRAMGSTFRTVHDVDKAAINPVSGRRYMAVEVGLSGDEPVSCEVGAAVAAGMPKSIAVFELIGLGQHFIRALKLHAEKVLIAL